MFMIDLGAESLYSKLGLSSDATQDEINTARDKIGSELLDELQKAGNDSEKKKKIEVRQREVNAAGETLGRPENRAKYNRENAHLQFFLLKPAGVPMFTDKADRFYVLHQVIVEFLATKNIKLAPLSDIDRLDFTSDEDHIELLDNLPQSSYR